MKMKLIAAILTLCGVVAAPVSNAQIIVGFGFDSCGYPGYYQTCPAFGPPTGVYLGGGGWGRGADSRDEHRVERRGSSHGRSQHGDRQNGRR
ncbi:hypothetical protein [Undibacterium sp. RuRC25W]|uniref:hypothetical protein n=1 Tax=Undibacterium sp. RuRC25W TaxID=3413047 RepID=UPI003BF2994F